MPEPHVQVTVVDDPARKRFDAFVGDRLAGFVTYRTRPGAVVLVHTEIDADFEGHGVGGQLASDVLGQIRERDLKVEPLCPFIAALHRPASRVRRSGGPVGGPAPAVAVEPRPGAPRGRRHGENGALTRTGSESTRHHNSPGAPGR